jgi:hypothetical protein
MQHHEDLYRYALEHLNTLRQQAEVHRLTKQAMTGHQLRKSLADSLRRLASRLEPSERVMPAR